MPPIRWSLVLCTLAMLVAASSRGQAPIGASRVEELERTVSDRKSPPSERGEALATLEQIDFGKAVVIAKEAITDPDEKVRFRAAWILADAGLESGKSVLREMAANRNSGLTLPILALGRLRDPLGHEQLRRHLEEELTDGLGKANRSAGASRATSLIGALGDYEDPRDAQLLADAVQTFYSSTDWVIVDALGRTGGREAIPELQNVFAQTTRGSTHLAAALGLFRCGSALGRDFVLAALRGQNETAQTVRPGRPSDVEDARDFILRHLGAMTDEVLTAELIAILRNSRTGNHERAEVWDALLRIDTKMYDKEILELARKDLKYRAAARVLAVRDPAGVRSLLAGDGSSKTTYEHALLQEALSATDRERRRWRELHGYAF